jgi:hypothetical protein
MWVCICGCVFDFCGAFCVLAYLCTECCLAALLLLLKNRAFVCVLVVFLCAQLAIQVQYANTHTAVDGDTYTQREQYTNTHTQREWVGTRTHTENSTSTHVTHSGRGVGGDTYTARTVRQHTHTVDGHTARMTGSQFVQNNLFLWVKYVLGRDSWFSYLLLVLLGVSFLTLPLWERVSRPLGELFVVSVSSLLVMVMVMVLVGFVVDGVVPIWLVGVGRCW